MRINPEFRRNVWVQFTWTRLIAVPLITVILCYAFLLVWDALWLQRIAEFVGGSLIVGLWGTRRAADSLAEEISGGTWESQRMSGLGAWQMTWGKLLGSVSFVWYCTAIALLVTLWASNRVEAEGGVGRDPLLVAFDFVVGGLLAQSTAFAIGLILMRKAARYRRLTITLAQSCGFLLYFFFVRGGFWPHATAGIESSTPGGLGLPIGNDTGADLVRIIAIAIACAWSVVGAYRLMRIELQYRNLPWVWILFLAFLVAGGVALSSAPAAPVALALPFYALVLVTYLSFFADNRDPVRYRWALLAVRARNWLEVASAIPWWLISYVVAAAVAVVLAWTVSPVPADLPSFSLHAVPPALGMYWIARQAPAASVTLLMLFVLRDLLVMLWFSCSPWRAKADVAGIIYLALVYWPLAAILWYSGGQKLLPVVVPIATGLPGYDFLPIAIELAFALLLFYARWREITRLEPRKA